MDAWTREFEDAVKLSDDIYSRVSERPTEASRLAPQIRRKLTMLGTRLESLHSLLNNSSVTKSLNEKELTKRQGMVENLRTKMKQMTEDLNGLQTAERNNLLGQESENGESNKNVRTSGLDNSGILLLQRQFMREQDDDLAKLEDTALSTKHIALAVNEELDLHSRLLDELDQDVDVTNNRFKVVQRRLAYLSKKVNRNCSCMSLVMMVLAIVMLVLVLFAVIKYL